MKKNLRKLLRFALLVFAVVCMVIFALRVIEDRQGEEAYSSALAIATGGSDETEPQATEAPAPTAQTVVIRREWLPVPVEEDEHMLALKDIDLKALQEVNPDVVGWLFIPDTKINYPVMQGEDNEYYLRHTWEKQENGMGSVFMECRNDGDFSDFNTILYGHNMNSGAMFADLKDFTSSWFRGRNPYIYVVTQAGIYRYEVFSYHSPFLDSFAYGLSFNQQETREDFIAQAIEASMAEIGISFEPAYTDRILTLSTCTGGSREKRFVVHAVMQMQLTEVE